MPVACSQHFPPEVARQLEEPLYFVDFLRPPITDNETGEVLDAHPSCYESVSGGLPDIRRVALPPCQLSFDLQGTRTRFWRHVNSKVCRMLMHVRHVGMCCMLQH